VLWGVCLGGGGGGNKKPLLMKEFSSAGNGRGFQRRGLRQGPQIRIKPAGGGPQGNSKVLKGATKFEGLGESIY